MSDAWIPFYPSDWLKGTRSLTPAEAGLYVTLTAMMYDKGAPLDMPRGRLVRTCNASPAAFAKALKTLIDEGKIIETERGLWATRVEKELKLREQKRDQARENASTGWKKRKGKQRQPKAGALNPQCESDATRARYQNTPLPPTDVGGVIDGMKEGPERDFLREAAADGADPNAIRSWSRGGFQVADAGGRTVLIVDGMHDRFEQAFQRTYDRLGFLCWSRTYADARGGLTLKPVPQAERGPDWQARVQAFFASRSWSPAWGPEPGMAGCKAPPELVKAARERAA